MISHYTYIYNVKIVETVLKVLYNKKNAFLGLKMKNYYRDAIYYIIDSKISTDRKLKLIFNLKFMIEDKRKEGIICYIDEKGFEQIKERIIKEENELKNSESSEN